MFAVGERKRAVELFKEQKQAVYIRTDRLFAILLFAQWLAGIFLALFFSPQVWAGRYSDTHIHVWTAIFLGGAIIARPIYLACIHPGQTLTRHTIAIAQMLSSSLLIHLTGGRIESHFHIFGSLAFLSCYRDWRVLITASVVTMFDHILRGFYFPMSIYGTTILQPWRWIEHTWWVLFEDAFLIKCCLDNVNEMRSIAFRQAEIEATKENVEVIVLARTAELKESQERLTTQFAVTSALTEASSLPETAPTVLRSLALGLLQKRGQVAAIVWMVDKESGNMTRVSQMQLDLSEKTTEKELKSRPLTNLQVKSLEELRLAQMTMDARQTVELHNHNQNITLYVSKDQPAVVVGNAFAFPMMAEDMTLGVVGFFCEAGPALTFDQVSMLESLGRQLGEFALKVQVESDNLRLANLLEWSRDAIIGQNLDGRITSWNRGAELFFGYSADQMKGQHISVLSPPDKLSEIDDMLMRSRSGDAVESFETERMTRDGQRVPVLLTQSPIFDDRQKILGVSTILHNISERKDAERRVSEFYSIVSHELRTPLTSIRGVLGLVENGVVDASSEEAAGLLLIARESTDRLIRLINDMLDLKKIESGKMDFNFDVIPARAFVQECLNSLEGMAGAANVTLSHSLRYHDNFFADRDKATQILTNLVSNAIKFSPAGSDVKIVCEEGDAGMVRFKVIDVGPGIKASDKARLFEKFQQLDASDSRATNGTGLGLAISKAMAEEQGGAIGLESEPGMGSIFWFELPGRKRSAEDLTDDDDDDDAGNSIDGQSRSDADETRTQEQTLESIKDEDPVDTISDVRLGRDMSRSKILLVEDDQNLASVLRTYFKKSGFTTTWVSTVKAAQEKINKHGETKIGIVVLDINLPDGSGLEILQRIKNDETLAHIPVIVMSGEEKDRRNIVHATVADWLSKPFHSVDLVKLVERLSAGQELQSVLVADRDTGARRVLGSQIEALGLHCQEAGDSKEAMAVSENASFDMIIMDAEIADQVSIEKFKTLRFPHKSDSKVSTSPVIVYSSKNVSRNEKRETRARNLGKTKQQSRDEADKSSLMDAMSAILGDLCK